VIAVTGDAGFMMNSQEIETAIRMKTPIVILIWNDSEYGQSEMRFDIGNTAAVIGGAVGHEARLGVGGVCERTPLPRLAIVLGPLTRALAGGLAIAAAILAAAWA